MKRSLYRIIGAVLFSGFLAAAALPAAWASESLTKAPAPSVPGLWADEPYDSTAERLTETDENGWRVILTRADLLYLMNHEELWDAGIHFRLGTDIDLAGSEDQRSIGDAGRHFSGIFRGDGHTVSGLRLHGSLDGLGLFGYAENAEISGLTVEGTIISTAPAPRGTFVRRTSVGGVVGVGVNHVELDGCVNRCRITARNASYVGGVIGSVAGNDGEAVIRGCVNEGKVKGYEYSGGLIGYGAGVSVSVISGRNTGNITSQMHVGGIAGCLDGGADRDEQTEIRECMNLGSILSTSAGGEAYAGGIIGTARFTGVYSSINSGLVSSIGKYTGGIIGYGYTENGTAYYLIGCYNGGQVTNVIGIALGAIIGDGIGEGLIAENNYFSAGTENGLLHAIFLKGNHLPDEILQLLSGIGGKWINTSMGPQLEGVHRHESSGTSPVDGETHRSVCRTCGELIDSGRHEWSTSVRYYKYCQICHYSDRMPTDGDGYRIIDDKDALLDLMTDSTLWGAGTKYRLTADIDLEGDSAQQSIGSNAKGKHFMGTFDGNGHTISGLALTGSGGNLGLFGYTEKAVIKNLTIEGTITAGGSVRSVGGLVGANINGITIENCVNRCDVTAEEGTYVGGIVGQIYNVTKTQGMASVISGCVNEGAVNGYRDTGGIVGYTVTANTNNASYPNNLIAVINCRNAGPVTADSYVGGIAGFLRDYRSGSNQTYLSGCLNTGTVTATVTGEGANANAGGIAGVAWISNVSGSMNTGAVASQAFRTGGIVGYGYTAGGAAYAITGNYNTGAVTSTASSRKGAVIGSAAADGLTAADNYYYKENSGSVGDSYSSSAVTAADVSDETAFSALYAKTGLWLYTVEGPELTRFHVHVPEEERVLRPVKGDPLHHRKLCVCLQPETGVGELGTHEWGWADSRKICADCSFKPALLTEWDGKTDAAGRRLIENAADLSKVIENYTLWGEDASYLMTADISLAGQLQRPIGDSGHHFFGSFDGGNHTVSGIDLTGDRYIGFFGYVDNAEICNLTIEGRVALAEETESGQSIGGLIGACPHAVIVKNCVNRCVVSAGDAKYVGGIAGYLYTRGQSQIEDCRNEAEVSGGNLVGGVIGYIEGNGTVDDHSILIRNCSNTAAVAGTEYVGGILGQSDTGKNKNNEDIFISLCRNTGNIEAVRYVGGIAGYLRDTGYTISKDQTTLYQCLNEGAVTASASAGESAYAGGITGAVAYSNIAYSMNTGKVSSAGKRVGGITGSGYTASVDAKYWIAWCYNAGEIEGPDGSTCAIAGYAMDEEHGGKEGLQLENNFFSKGEGKHGSSSILHGTQIELTEGEIADRNKFVSLFEGSHPDVWLYTADGPELRVFHTHQAESERRMLPVADDYENMHQKLCICLLPETAVGERAEHVFKMTDGRMACETCPYKQPSLAEWDGKTDEQDRAVIENAAGLQKLMANEGLWGSPDAPVAYVLSDDIDLKALEWQQPIGNHSKPFYGSFDGADHTISGINLSSESEYTGFFGYVVNTTIENLTIEGSVTSSGAHSIGGLVGATPGSITLTNCTNRCTVTAENAEDVGGLIGRIFAQAEVSIADCVNEANVTGKEQTGGVVGFIDATSANVAITIDSCTNAGVVTAVTKTGGIVGYVNAKGTKNLASMIITSCRNEAEIRATGTADTDGNVGGIIGELDANATLTSTDATFVITECSNSGEISGRIQVGGIAGITQTGAKGNVPIHITRCYNNGAINGIGTSKSSGSKWMGGIVGYLKDTGYTFTDGQTELSECLNEGQITNGYAYLGGIAGQVTYANIMNSMNSGAVKGASTSLNIGGIVGNGYNKKAGSGYNPYEVSYNFNKGEVSGASASTHAVIGSATTSGLGTESNYYTAGPDDSGHGMKVESEKLSERESFSGLYEKTETWLYTTKGPELEAFHEHDKSKEEWKWLPCEEDPMNKHQQYCICGEPMGEAESHQYEGDSTVCTVCKFDSSNPRDDEGRYMISTADGLLALMERAANGDKTALSDNYILTENIDLTGKEGQKPIGTSSNQFTGSFDGNGHAVKGINISGGDYTAFFGYVNGATISNLTIEGAINSTGSQSVGGLVGACPTGVTIENCVNKCTVTARNANYVGGIVGYIYAKGKVSSLENCTNEGAITGKTQAGGIIGCVKVSDNPASMTIIGCSNTAKIEAANGNVGGIIGELDANATLTSTDAEFGITECSNSGNISGKTQVGGIVGITQTGYKESTGSKTQYGNVPIHISFCYNSGTISGTGTSGSKYIGGIAGYLKDTGYGKENQTNLSECLNEGRITNGYANLGGIAGQVTYANIMNSMNSGVVEGASTSVNIGGIVGQGYTSSNGKYSVSFNYNKGSITTKNTSSDAAAKAVIGKPSSSGLTTQKNYYSAGPTDTKATLVTEDALKNQASFEGFDFENIWMMTADGPVLRYFNPEAMMLSLATPSNATPSNATPSNATPSNAIPLGAVGKVPGRTDSEKDGEPAGGLPDYPVATSSNPEDRRTKKPSEEDGRTSGGEEGDENQPYPAATPPNASAVRREEEGDEQF